MLKYMYKIMMVQTQVWRKHEQKGGGWEKVATVYVQGVISLSWPLSLVLPPRRPLRHCVILQQRLAKTD